MSFAESLLEALLTGQDDFAENNPNYSPENIPENGPKISTKNSPFVESRKVEIDCTALSFKKRK